MLFKKSFSDFDDIPHKAIYANGRPFLRVDPYRSDHGHNDLFTVCNRASTDFGALSSSSSWKDSNTPFQLVIPDPPPSTTLSTSLAGKKIKSNATI